MVNLRRKLLSLSKKKKSESYQRTLKPLNYEDKNNKNNKRKIVENNKLEASSVEFHMEIKL